MRKNKFYIKRYFSPSEKRKYLVNRLKASVFKALISNRFTIRLVNILDHHEAKKYIWLNNFGFLIKRENLIINDEPESGTDSSLVLKTIMFLEAIEIDSIEKLKDSIITTFSNHDRISSFIRDERDTMTKVFSKVNDFDTISYGKLFYLDYRKKTTEQTDLISSIRVNYIKTSESYFVIQILVSPSEKFLNQFKDIINHDVCGFDVPVFNSFTKIIKTKRFFNGYQLHLSNLNFNVGNLISDLTFQVKKDVSKHFKGHFNFGSLPSIQAFEVDAIETFLKDTNLSDYFHVNFGEYYHSDDNQILVYPATRSKEMVTKIVKVKGHGERKNERVNADYSQLETVELMNSLAFPCVFHSILDQQNQQLNQLKREVYDFGNNSKSSFFNLNFFKRYMRNVKYVRLKHRLAKILMITKRFENEFNDRSIHILTNRYNLKNFYHSRRNKEQNLHETVIVDLKQRMEGLSDKTVSINEIFKIFEELYAHRTNYILQMSAIFLTVIGFIFSFSMIKRQVLIFIDWLF